MHPHGLYPPDGGRKGEPAVKEQMPRRGSCRHGQGNHIHQHVGGFPHALLTAFVAVGPLVDTIAHRGKAVLLLGGAEHRQHHGDKAVAIGPPQGEHPETTHVPAGIVVMHTGQQFNPLAAIAAVQGVVGDQHLGCRLIGQREQPLDNDPRAEQKEKTAPVGSNRVQQPVRSVFTDAGWCIWTLQQAEQILSGKGKGKQELEQGVEANAFFFPDVALPK